MKDHQQHTSSGREPQVGETNNTIAPIRQCLVPEVSWEESDQSDVVSLPSDDDDGEGATSSPPSDNDDDEDARRAREAYFRSLAAKSSVPASARVEQVVDQNGPAPIVPPPGLPVAHPPALAPADVEVMPSQRERCDSEHSGKSVDQFIAEKSIPFVSIAETWWCKEIPAMIPFCIEARDDLNFGVCNSSHTGLRCVKCGISFNSVDTLHKHLVSGKHESVALRFCNSGDRVKHARVIAKLDRFLSQVQDLIVDTCKVSYTTLPILRAKRNKNSKIAARWSVVGVRLPSSQEIRSS